MHARLHGSLPLAFVLLTLQLGELACGGWDSGARRDPGTGSMGAAQDSASSGADTLLAITDATGRQLYIRTPVSRVVSLVPSATETLQALGATSLLVGRTDYETNPALQHLPSVGGGLRPNLETLAALGPDLVIRFAGASDPVTPSQLDRLGIPHFAIEPNRLDDVFRIIAQLGQLVGREIQADSLSNSIQSELRSVGKRIEGRQRRRVAYLLGGHPPLVAGPGTFISDLLAVAGAENVFSDLTTRYAQVSLEEFLSRPIDLVLFSSISSPDLPQGLHRRPVPEEFEIPGVHVAESARQLALILHPEAFR